jgi:opacity protein-like surface antigen
VYPYVLDKVHPYVSGGASFLSSEIEVSNGFATVSDDDSSFGFYVGGGLNFDVTESFFIGAGLRKSFAHEVTLGGVEGDADFTQVFLRIGAAF